MYSDHAGGVGYSCDLVDHCFGKCNLTCYIKSIRNDKSIIITYKNYGS